MALTSAHCNAMGLRDIKCNAATSVPVVKLRFAAGEFREHIGKLRIGSESRLPVRTALGRVAEKPTL